MPATKTRLDSILVPWLFPMERDSTRFLTVESVTIVNKRLMAAAAFGARYIIRYCAIVD